MTSLWDACLAQLSSPSASVKLGPSAGSLSGVLGAEVAIPPPLSSTRAVAPAAIRRRAVAKTAACCEHGGVYGRRRRAR